ncbi:hypothetical protein DUNSADRAFT_10503 [Dunaliella salina]|uniref:Uncharacterized protein n=1 Tax=Dunaliella salina TaxID=3046 RepID=A0ABQ7FSB7_DUNSA|nr:hypothetical protein DUNSADRAFT_10503 [Dunaliella salina]|eukprot:KAF5825408.1 hypothetical protein DUNSADRAFT_10503 [Dunaliella salina]
MTHSQHLAQQNQEFQARQQQQQMMVNMTIISRLFSGEGGGSPAGPSMGGASASGSGTGMGGVGGSGMASGGMGAGVHGDLMVLMSNLMGAASSASGAQGPPHSHAPHPPM